MRQLGEQWIEEGSDGKIHMYKAVEGPKIVNGLMEGNTCHGCCYVDKWDDDCLNPNQACPVGKGVIIKDLGPVNKEGVLACPFCGEYLDIIEWPNGFYLKHKDKLDCILGVTNSFPTKQACIEAWNRRTI